MRKEPWSGVGGNMDLQEEGEGCEMIQRQVWCRPLDAGKSAAETQREPPGQTTLFLIRYAISKLLAVCRYAISNAPANLLGQQHHVGIATRRKPSGDKPVKHLDPLLHPLGSSCSAHHHRSTSGESHLRNSLCSICGTYQPVVPRLMVFRPSPSVE